MMTDRNSPDAGAGCCAGCGSPPAGRQAEPEIACTLGAGDFEVRIAMIRDLARRHLRRSDRDGLMLRLVYDGEARSEVEEFVARERLCCAFLDFELRHDEDGVQVVIVAPAAAAEAAEMLFAHFAPELAREAT
ncbi:MAG: hypothetical protein KF899_15465 [Parvibaculum sp.]|nr:hypothetical protein [Parvibaculum sp.]